MIKTIGTIITLELSDVYTLAQEPAWLPGLGDVCRQALDAAMEEEADPFYERSCPEVSYCCQYCFDEWLRRFTPPGLTITIDKELHF